MVYSLDEFCSVHGISRAFLYLLQERGEAPDIMHVGNRRLVSAEAAAAWRKARTVKAITTA
jgi:hypothetical protein